MGPARLSPPAQTATTSRTHRSVAGQPDIRGSATEQRAVLLPVQVHLPTRVVGGRFPGPRLAAEGQVAAAQVVEHLDQPRPLGAGPLELELQTEHRVRRYDVAVRAGDPGQVV